MAAFIESLRGIGGTAWVFIMVIAVVLIQAIVTVVRLWIRHRERMAMIEKGMDPRSGAENPGKAKKDEDEDD